MMDDLKPYIELEQEMKKRGTETPEVAG